MIAVINVLNVKYFLFVNVIGTWIMSLTTFYILAPSKICALQVDHKLRKDYEPTTGIRRDSQFYHEIVIALNQLNPDKLEKIVHEVSDPSSPTYGRYLSREEIGKLTFNQPGLDVVREFLRANEIMDHQETPYGEYVTVKSSLEKWETLFGAKFMPYKHIISGAICFRSSVYELPAILTEHVYAIYNILELPFIPNKRTSLKENIEISTSLCSSCITPTLLNSFYHIFTNQGNSLTSQTVYSSLQDYYSSTDITTFQNDFGIPLHPVDHDISKRDQPSQCTANWMNCIESNLDLQYIMSVAQNTPTSIV